MVSFADILQYVFSGITIGAIYAMVGLGFTMVYNSTSIINFAQGEFVMLGGLLGVTFVSGAKNFGVPAPYAIALGFVLAVGTTTLVGMLMEKVAIEPTDRLTPFHYAGLAIIIFALARILGGLTVGPALAVMIVLTVAAYLLLRRKTVESMRNPSVLQLIIITIALSILIRGIAMFTFGKTLTSWHALCEAADQHFGATVRPKLADSSSHHRSVDPSQSVFDSLTGRPRKRIFQPYIKAQDQRPQTICCPLPCRPWWGQWLVTLLHPSPLWITIVGPCWR
jgi:branched-subunit amino acid ABC-type transport system permease component